MAITHQEGDTSINEKYISKGVYIYTVIKTSLVPVNRLEAFLPCYFCPKLLEHLAASYVDLCPFLVDEKKKKNHLILLLGEIASQSLFFSSPVYIRSNIIRGTTLMRLDGYLCQLNVGGYLFGLRILYPMINRICNVLVFRNDFPYFAPIVITSKS